MVWNVCNHSPDDQPVHSKHRNFIHHPDDQFDQYMFVLRISIFEMKALISYTSNTILDKNRPYIGGERWFGIFDATALMISPQASENFTHPDASIDQYIVVLRISTLFMTTLISCTSKTLPDRNRS